MAKRGKREAAEVEALRGIYRLIKRFASTP